MMSLDSMRSMSISSDEKIVPIVTIDGPAASGKSTVSRELAKALNWKWVSTGAFYRGLAYVAAELQISAADVDALLKLVHSPRWEVRMEDQGTDVLFDGRVVTPLIHSERVGQLASQISQIPRLRQELLAPQRACARGVGLVAEGRDCGTVVFPNAIVKVYLTASSEARAQRRALEKGLGVQEILDSQKERDRQDQTRAAAPLQIPERAIVVDTNELKVDQVVQILIGHINSAMAQSVKSL